MRTIHFGNLEDFICNVANIFNDIKHNNYNDVSIIAKYDSAKEILNMLIGMNYNIASININNDEVPYIISLCTTETRYGDIWCEPTVINGEYVYDGSTVTYVMDNCPSEVLKYIESKTIYEVSVGECREECDYDCKHECCSKNHKTDEITPAGTKPTSTATSTYKVNGKEVSRDEFEKFKKKIDDEYLDTVRNMLLKHCSIMDEINEMSRLLRW